MAKKGGVDLTKAQKEEIRRLTQLANRRIKAAQRAYEKEGKMVLPREIAGDIQVKEKWEQANYALSRSTKFATAKEYRERLKFLRSFEREKVGIKEYTEGQRIKSRQALITSIGDIPEGVEKVIDKMTAPQLSTFWKRFSDKAARAGFLYSSNATMLDTLADLFPEDMQNIVVSIMSPIPSKG